MPQIPLRTKLPSPTKGIGVSVAEDVGLSPVLSIVPTVPLQARLKASGLKYVSGVVAIPKSASV